MHPAPKRPVARRPAVLVSSAAIAAALGAVLSSAPARADTAGAFDCLIEPSAWVELAPETAGVIDKVHVSRGERVKAGQLVASLRSNIEKWSRELAAARAKDASAVRLKRTKETFELRRLKRHRQLIADRVVNAQEADEIKTAVQIARFERGVEQAALDRATLEVSRADALLAAREVRSTIDGVVLAREKDPGEHVDGEAIVTIVTLDPLHVEVFAPIPVAKRLKQGDRAEVLSPDEAPKQATVKVIDRVADAASRTVKVRLELPNKDLSVIAGQNCRVRFPDVAGR